MEDRSYLCTWCCFSERVALVVSIAGFRNKLTSLNLDTSAVHMARMAAAFALQVSSYPRCGVRFH